MLGRPTLTFSAALKPQGNWNMRWFIHIGIRKSGSKAIQRFLAEETLRPNAEVYFPVQGREGIWHQPLYFALLEEDGSLLDATLAAQSLQDQNVGVFSYERLHDLPSRSIRIIREKLGDAQVILFIRRQDQAINSLLNQFAKAHRTSFAQVMEFERTITHYNPSFDYQAILSRWADVFGAEAIVPIIYDKRTDALGQFCKAMGIPFTQTDELLPNPNPALSRSAYDAFLSAKAAVSDAAELPVLVNHLHESFAAEMINTMSEEGPRLLDEGKCHEIMQNYEASNEYVRNQWFPSRSSLFED
jgi:hypothetical protein